VEREQIVRRAARAPQDPVGLAGELPYVPGESLCIEAVRVSSTPVGLT
jgi:hypothetical protein